MPGASRVFAGVSGSPGSVHALRHAADLARQHDAVLIPLHAWVPPCGDLDERKHPSLELRQLWEDDAWQLLWDTLYRAFGGLPAGLAIIHGYEAQLAAGCQRVPRCTYDRGAFGRQVDKNQYISEDLNHFSLKGASAAAAVAWAAMKPGGVIPR